MHKVMLAEYPRKDSALRAKTAVAIFAFSEWFKHLNSNRRIATKK